MSSQREGEAREVAPAPTFAIVTALPEESAAVRIALDSPRDLPPREGDQTRYAIGTLPSAATGSPHEIVLMQIPDPGNSTAAAAVTNLVRSFPTVSYVVMAGIAAGVPNPGEPSKHVRLGDIVVARWGVIDYDHVDETRDGVSLRRGVSRPSPFLAAAADGLREGEALGQRPWEQWLDKAAGRPDLATYCRPADDTDILYASDGSGTHLAHPDRAESGHRRGFPKVHYGLVGTADRSLSNAAVRDILAARHDLRAFEMEAKGVGTSSFINGREWFVVRGISDYADERRTGTWRNYAALAAAAYVRALLAERHPVKPYRPQLSRWVRMSWRDRGVVGKVSVIALALALALVVAVGVALGTVPIVIALGGNGPPPQPPPSPTVLAPSGKPPGPGKSFDVYAHYDPRGLIGDIGDISRALEPGHRLVSFTYETLGRGPHEWEYKFLGGSPNPDACRFAGALFLDGDWGRESGRGYDLRGRHVIRWQARSRAGPVYVEFFAGGVSWVWDDETQKRVQAPYPDSLRREVLGRARLTEDWQSFSWTITSTPDDLAAVIGPFGWTITWDSNGVVLGQAKTFVIEVKDVTYERLQN